jgi:hypothetical protein
LFCNTNLPPKMMPVTTPTMTPAANRMTTFHSVMGAASLQKRMVKVALLPPLLSRMMSLMKSLSSLLWTKTSPNVSATSWVPSKSPVTTG